MLCLPLIPRLPEYGDFMANSSSPLTTISDYLDDARSAGAKAAEFTCVASSGHRVEVRGGRVTNTSAPQGYRLQGWVYLADGRSASFSTESTDQQRARARIATAVQQAKSSDPDPLAGPVERYDITTRGLGTDDVRYPNIAMEDREEVALINEETCTGAPGLTSQGCVYEDRRTIRAYASSRSIQVESASTYYEVQLQARLGDRTLAHTASARNFANVGSLPFGVDLARRLLALQGSEEVPKVALPSVDLPMVMNSRVMSWLIDHIGPAFSQRAVDAGKVFLANHIGQRIASPKVHLMDDAGLHGGLRTYAFDDRGVPPMALPVIREGLQAGLYYDPEAARAKEIRSTGHVINGDLRPGNLILLAGNRSRTQMLSEVPNSICFDHIEGNLNLRTGKLDVSGPAFLLEKGRHIGVIEKVRLKTDIITLLSGVQEVASDQERYEAVDCATALITGVPLHS